MKRKYPLSLFLWGALLTFLFRHRYLFISSILLLIAGIWNDWLRSLGLALLVINLVLSITDQLSARHTLLNSEAFDSEWKDAVCSPNWPKNIAELAAKKIAEHEGIDLDESEDHEIQEDDQGT